MTASGKEKISIDCFLAGIYFLCLPFTVVTTPFGSLLKIAALPIVTVLLIRLFMGKSDLAFNYIHFFYGLYIVCTAFLLIVDNDEIAFTTTKDMALGALMLMLITIRIYNAREKEFLENVWLAVGIICVFTCLTSKEVMSEYENRTVIRILGFEEDQNQFCAYLVMPALVCVKRIVRKDRLSLAYMLLLALSFYAILKTGSRGGLIGVFFGVAAYVLIGIKDVKIRIGVALATVFAVFLFYIAVMPFLPDDVRARYSVEAIKDDGGSGRFEIWSFLIDYTLQRPERLIRGSGIFSTYSVMYSAGFQNSVAHNAYIQILHDQGILGLLLFMIVTVLCITRNIKKEPAYSSAILALLAFSMSLSFYVFKPYLNIMMMCAMSFEGTLPEQLIINSGKGEIDNV